MRIEGIVGNGLVAVIGTFESELAQIPSVDEVDFGILLSFKNEGAIFRARVSIFLNARGTEYYIANSALTCIHNYLIAHNAGHNIEILLLKVLA